MVYIQVAVVQGRGHDELREVQMTDYGKFENGTIISLEEVR